MKTLHGADEKGGWPACNVNARRRTLHQATKLARKLPFYSEQLFTPTLFTPNNFYTKELLLTSNTSYTQDLFRLNTFKLKHCV